MIFILEKINKHLVTVEIVFETFNNISRVWNIIMEKIYTEMYFYYCKKKNTGNLEIIKIFNML